MVISAGAPLVLGSASPRRREILGSLGVPIDVVPGEVDETPRPGEPAAAYLDRIARAKLSDVAGRVAARSTDAAAGPAPCLLVADTIVVLDGAILGKPRDEPEARRLLARIVGRAHLVWTRYAISRAPSLALPAVVRTVESIVKMRRADDGEIARYAATGEGLDKAGAYAAQGIGTFLIERIEGSFSNVVGLPACEVVQDLLELGLLESFPLRAP